ncbi:MAG: prephenate dehydratase [Acidimicrobiaceae bacterium]|nr:prephenate dehydratase [Acidimicrobiaceae bacterium]
MATAGSSSGIPSMPPSTRIGYMGPHGTFTEAALATQPDLWQCDLTPLISVPEVLSALDDGAVDYGFVPVENAIEGAVNVTQDALAFDFDFLIQREVVVNVQLDLMALAGTATDDDLSAIHTVLSFPVAIAQCRAFLHDQLPDAAIEAATSTALAARRIGEEQLAGVAAIASPAAAEIYGLETVTESIEDHRDNQTRFLLLANGQVPPASGNDKTSIVVFQQQNEPGSLLGILMEFEARRLDLSRLESRPTRRGLGEYCFLLDFEGHISDEVVADCLRALKMKQRDVKFLGSFPAANGNSSGRERVSEEAWTSSDDWLKSLRRLIT